MATVYLTYAIADSLPIMQASSGKSETVTSSGTSASGGITCRNGDVVQVFCATSVAVTAGTTPTATLAGGIVAPAGTTIYLRPKEGDKIAVIDV